MSLVLGLSHQELQLAHLRLWTLAMIHSREVTSESLRPERTLLPLICMPVRSSLLTQTSTPSGSPGSLIWWVGVGNIAKPTRCGGTSLSCRAHAGAPYSSVFKKGRDVALELALAGLPVGTRFMICTHHQSCPICCLADDPLSPVSHLSHPSMPERRSKGEGGFCKPRPPSRCE